MISFMLIPVLTISVITSPSLATNQRNEPDLPFLSVASDRGEILLGVSNMGENHNFMPDNLSDYNLAREGRSACHR